MLDRLHPVATRRSLLASLAALPCLPASARVPSRQLRLAILTDLHQDVMHDAPERLKQFLDAADTADVDLVIQLGDFCQPHPRNQPLIDLWNSCPRPKFHVLGNHDMDGGYRREQTVEFYGMPSRYYSFDAGPCLGVVLDTNDPGGTAKGYKKWIAEDQQRWLQTQLAQSDRPSLIFLHHPVDDPNGIENRSQVRGILEQAQKDRPGSIAGVFSGHFHQDYAIQREGISYFQINSASYVWLPDNAHRETYPAELHQKHPYLKNVAAYQTPLWAIATIDVDHRTVSIEGRQSQWQGPDIWQRGVPESEYPRDKNRPAISDQKLSW